MKKTGIDKVIGRKPYTILYKVYPMKNPPFKEQVVVRDFTSKNMYYG